MSIYEKLKEYKDKGIYPFHMPGHKRNTEILSFDTDPVLIDVTEVKGTDNLHLPTEMILERQKKCAEIFGAQNSYFLINGSTAGIISAICSLAEEGGKIIMARNSHKAAYSGLIYSKLCPLYVYPRMNKCGIPAGINPSDIKKLLEENKDVKGVFITSPTFEGYVSDIKAISDLCHLHNVPLIIDEAHGPHFKFSSYFPKTALEMGADIVIQSLHKTLPSVTQTAVLHTQGKLINENHLKLHLTMIQSSSPSYILMSAIDQCIGLLDKGMDFKEYTDLLTDYREKAKEYRNFSLIDASEIGNFDIFDIDLGKLTFVLKKEYENIENDLLEQRIQIEMADNRHFILMTSICDKKLGFQMLHKALKEIDSKIENLKDKTFSAKEYPRLEIACHLFDTISKSSEKIHITHAEGRTSAGFLTPYPPGIPLIVPGEIINSDVLAYINQNTAEEYIDVLEK